MARMSRAAEIVSRFVATPSSSRTLAVVGACAFGIALLRKLRSREVHRLRAEFEEAVLSSERLARQLNDERAAAAELASARDLELAELKAQLERLAAKLESFNSGAESVASPSSPDRRKVPAALHVAGEMGRASSRGHLTPLSTERKWNSALLRSLLFASEASIEDSDGRTSVGKPKKLAL